MAPPFRPAGGRASRQRPYQLHVRLARQLPDDPGAAAATVHGLANNLEARVAGGALVGDNLGARLDGVREDALYARVLFLFLGLPGVVLAIVLTVAIAAAGATRHRQEQALLRIRGAGTVEVLRLQLLETILAGIGGVVLGILLGTLALRLIAGVSVTAPARVSVAFRRCSVSCWRRARSRYRPGRRRGMPRSRRRGWWSGVAGRRSGRGSTWM